MRLGVWVGMVGMWKEEIGRSKIRAESMQIQCSHMKFSTFKKFK